MIETRVQMIGTQRSGSNLLRLMLDQLPEVFAPPSVHVLRDFQDLVPAYGPLTEDQSFRSLIHDVIAVINENVLKWPVDSLSVDTVFDQCSGRTLEHVYSAVHDVAADRCAKAWVSKSLENVERLDRMREAIPGLQVLHLLRDPRDVALSFTKAPIGPKHPVAIAWIWIEHQKLAAKHAEGAESSSWNEVRYEDLVVSPRDTVEQLCSAYNISFSGDVTGFYQRLDAREAPELSSLWANLDKPVQAANSGKYRLSQHREFVEAVEEAAYDSMITWGYEPLYARGQRHYSSTQINDIMDKDSELRRKHPEQQNPLIQAPHKRRDEILESVRRAIP
ncbi:sulfotransferase [Nonomuraea sp. B19D2]|uniref:sulfotransferase family protein n=1 Tax=Nonomuraea sp. B19D2 TaxID=3159561 RepID=UPI0032DABBEC